MTSLYNRNSGYWPSRLVLVGLETIILGISGWLLLFQGTESLNAWFHWNLPTGNSERNILLFALIAIVYFRMFITIFVLLKRSIPWEEAFTIPIAFSVYYLGIPLFSLDQALNGWDVLFVMIFAVGSVLNTGSEWLRDRWKRNPENSGKLYTGGMFKYSIHINYFGDLLWVLALALITRNVWALIIPLLLFGFFAFYNIPMLDRHLERKYGEAFRAYRSTTKRFIPFLY